MSSSTEPKLITAAVAASVSAGTHNPLTTCHSARLRLGTGGGFSFFGFLVEGAASASATAFFDDAFFAASFAANGRHSAAHSALNLAYVAAVERSCTGVSSRSDRSSLPLRAARSTGPAWQKKRSDIAAFICGVSSTEDTRNS